MQCILCGCEESKAVVVKNRKSTKTFFRCTKCDFCFLERSQLLDYGCGHNPVLPQILRNKESQISKIDYYDLFFYPNLDVTKKYSCIFSIEVFEHFRDVYKEIEQAFSYLEYGGYFVLSTGFLPDENKFASWWYIQDATHISFYSERTFEWLADKFSLKPIFSNKKNLVIFQKL